MFHVNITYILREMEGEWKENRKLLNSAINKLCHKSEHILFLRYQYTANAPVLSDIDGSGPRERAHII